MTPLDFDVCFTLKQSHGHPNAAAKMTNAIFAALLLAGAFAGQAHGQIIEQQSSDAQLAMGLGVVDTFDSFCPDTASSHETLTHISVVVSATVDFKVVSAKFEEVVAEATAMGEDNWCVQTRPFIHNLLNSAEEKKSTSTERSFIGDLGNAYQRGREDHDLEERRRTMAGVQSTQTPKHATTVSQTPSSSMR
jgi:hypothetical protein